MAEITDAEIVKIATKAVADGELLWLGFDKDEDGKYTIPCLSPSDFKLVRAVLSANAGKVDAVVDKSPVQVRNDAAYVERILRQAWTSMPTGYSLCSQDWWSAFAKTLAPALVSPVATMPPEINNFCPRCGKRNHTGSIHTCTPPEEKL
jgi:hypothetical protein